MQTDSTRDVIPGFGAAVRQRREQSQMSLEAVAVKAGTHFTAISKVERSQRAPSLRLAAGIASALGVSLDVLLMDAARLAGAPVENVQPPAPNKKGRKRKG
jgi:transcriptional regulator with XRE-family HTH domain